MRNYQRLIPHMENFLFLSQVFTGFSFQKVRSGLGSGKHLEQIPYSPRSKKRVLHLLNSCSLLDFGRGLIRDKICPLDSLLVCFEFTLANRSNYVVPDLPSPSSVSIIELLSWCPSLQLRIHGSISEARTGLVCRSVVGPIMQR